MCLHKLCLYPMLATMLTFAVAEYHLNRSDLADSSANSVSLAESFRTKREMLPAKFLPAQSKDARSLRAGKVLVASRNLGDPLFTKTVILLVQYDSEAVLGLVLNRRTNIPISRALESVKGAKDRSDPVYVGGPVETPVVFALFQSQTKIGKAEPIFDDIYLIASKPLIEQAISARPDPRLFHVYLGYAGWTQEQLQKEVELGAWLIFPADSSTVFDEHPDSLWQEMIRKAELQLARAELIIGLLDVRGSSPTGAITIGRSIHDEYDFANYAPFAQQLMRPPRFQERISLGDYWLDFLLVQKAKQSDQILPKLSRLQPFESLDAIGDHPFLSRHTPVSNNVPPENGRLTKAMASRAARCYAPST